MTNREHAEGAGREKMQPLRVLAADDSAVMRGVMRTVFDLHANDSARSSLPRMELCGLVRDGVEALEAVRTLKPDVLLLDLEMPRMNGLKVLEELRRVAPHLPVIMCSGHTERGARSTLDALALGAKDYVMKPGQQKDFAAALDTLMEQLLPKIAELTGWNQTAPAERRTEIRLPAPARVGLPARGGTNAVELVAIGVSTGGPSALEQMLPMLPRDFAVPVMIVQHMPRLFTGALAERLRGLCRMPVEEARDGMRVEPGRILIAPGDAHMEVVSGVGRGRAVRLHKGLALNSCMPSVDYLFRSAATLCGGGTLALVMTGMGSDGLDGARAVRESGGTVLAQDEATSAVWGMPGRVVMDGLASATVPLGALAGELLQRVQAGRIPSVLGAAMAGRGGGEARREVSYGLL